MKALILKDIYVLWKQARVFLLMILVFSAIPSSFNVTFAVVYAALLPYTAMAYDERSRWDRLAAMLPYSVRDIVLSKYALGALTTLGAAILTAALQFLLTAVVRKSPAVPLSLILLAVCASVCILAITLPLMFRFGVEKGRLVMFLIIFLVCGCAGAMGSLMETAAGGYTLPMQVLALAPAAAVILTVISVPLSMRFYRQRMR